MEAETAPSGAVPVLSLSGTEQHGQCRPPTALRHREELVDDIRGAITLAQDEDFQNEREADDL
ncbi:hypothetical protein [Lautropia mirabilis]